jgi:signal transduction histidine kinase
MINPAEVDRQIAKPAIYMEKIIVDKRTVAAGPELSVPPGSHHVELHFGAIELQSPERIRLQYRLDGVDRDWLDADETATAIYTRLPLGIHSFHVRASNRDGVWDRSGITYRVTQKPYYYETGLFKVAMAWVVIGLLTVAYRLRVRQLAEQMREQFRVRTLERERIARELHDTLLQGYLSASFQAQAALGRLDEESAARQPLSRAIELMGQASRESRMVLRELRSGETDAWTLEHAFAHIPTELALSSDIHFVVRAKGKPRALRSTLRDEVFRIGREAIVNAYTHSKAKDIDVETEYSEEAFRLVVQDNGCGVGAILLEAGREGHWGMQGMKERSEGIGASLDLRSRPGAGTEIVLSIPSRLAFGDETRTKQSRLFDHLRRLLLS